MATKKASKGPAVKKTLDKTALKRVKGGIATNKAKTADKAYQQMDGYIKQ